VIGRIIRGLSLLFLFLGAHHLDTQEPGQPAWALASLGVVLAAFALDELLVMGGARGARRVIGWLAGLAWVAVLGLGHLPEPLLPVAVSDLFTAASIAAGVYLAVQLRHGPTEATGKLTESMWFSVPWVAGLGGFVALLVSGHVDLVLGLVLVSKGSDVGAYFAGKSFGRTKLAPATSPNKTWEGVAGGVLLSAAAGAWLLTDVPIGGSGGAHDASVIGSGSTLVLLPGGLLGGALHGLVLGAVAVLSDLTESLLKRARGVKDSGTLFGESGGFLDLADSLLLVAPCALAYTAVLGGQG
jgi:phosphatidate cytidylyltransferase